MHLLIPPLGPLSSAALYPPLIATLVALTSPPFDPPPEIIIAYKVYLSLSLDKSV